MGSSWTRDGTRVPCIGRRILNHCATTEVLCLDSFFFFNFPCGCPVVPAPLVEKTILLHCIAFAHLSKISWHIYEGLFLGSLFCSTDLFLFFHQYHAGLITVASLKLKYFLEVGECQSSNFVLLLQYCVGYLRFWLVLFSSPYKLWNQFVDVYKITCWDFDWDCIESCRSSWEELTSWQY